MGADNKARSLASVDGEKDVHTLDKDVGNKGSWLVKGFAGDNGGKKDGDDDDDKKEDDRRMTRRSQRENLSST
jgi:hypothetical protein